MSVNFSYSHCGVVGNGVFATFCPGHSFVLLLLMRYDIQTNEHQASAKYSWHVSFNLMSFVDNSHIFSSRYTSRGNVMTVILYTNLVCICLKNNNNNKKWKENVLLLKCSFFVVLCKRRQCRHMCNFSENVAKFNVWMKKMDEWDENNWVHLWNDLEDKFELNFRLRYT